MGQRCWLEQRWMFDIPVTWHILEHSQITISPNSQMCERGFISASPYCCHSLCFRQSSSEIIAVKRDFDRHK